ncbi:MAG: sigma-70 family RNA polymerase sigma factor [Chloroflexota bacterium]|nr:MAG: sigma-70 family RNA polymerase sigma factor [Chloroflexota bacterium]
MVERTMSLIHRPQPEEKLVTHLIAAARQDPQVFGELYLLYAQPVFRYLYSRIGGIPEAEDVTAQTFLAALERFPKYRHDGYFASWLFSIARNKAMDYFRKHRKEASLDEAERIPADANLLQQVIKTERKAALSKLIRALPEEDQELIRLRYVAELSFAEIGHMLGQKEDTVKKTLYRLLAWLKVQLEDSHA